MCRRFLSSNTELTLEWPSNFETNTEQYVSPHMNTELEGCRAWRYIILNCQSGMRSALIDPYNCHLLLFYFDGTSLDDPSCGDTIRSFNRKRWAGLKQAAVPRRVPYSNVWTELNKLKWGAPSRIQTNRKRMKRACGDCVIRTQPGAEVKPAVVRRQVLNSNNHGAVRPRARLLLDWDTP